MAVAVKTTTETAPHQASNRLAVGSLLGTLYVLVCLAILYSIPVVWPQALANATGVFVNAALQLCVVLGVAGLLVLLGRVLWSSVGQGLVGPDLPHGIRAGVAVGVVGCFLIGLFTRGIGASLESSLGDRGAAVGIPITLAIGIALLVAGAMLFFRAGFDRWLVTVEDQGWFGAAAYKRTQGQRVRRGTIIGILVLAGSGIWTLLSHNSLGTGAPHWEVTLPFTHGQTLILLPDLQFTVPLLLALIALWFAYRVVNFPVFADFLIATEAELNKVSWTTRRRLVQDTMVVLTTMLLLTAFLFAMDSLWIKLLSMRWVNVIQTERQDTRDLDVQIERLNLEEQAATAQGDATTATRLRNELEALSRQRESRARGKQGDVQEW